MAHGCHRVLEDAAKEIVEPSRDALSHDLVMKEVWGLCRKGQRITSTFSLNDGADISTRAPPTIHHDCGDGWHMSCFCIHSMYFNSLANPTN